LTCQPKICQSYWHLFRYSDAFHLRCESSGKESHSFAVLFSAEDRQEHALQVIQPRSGNKMVRFMQTPIFVPPSADRRVSVSAAKPILHLNVWMNPVLQYVDLERRQVQSNPLPAAGITRKQNLESCGVATLEFALRSQKLLLRPKPAGHINGNFPNGWLVHFRNVALASQKFPGQRGIRKSPSGTLEVALLGDGVAPENLYPLDVDRALDKLDTIREQILWWETGAQLQQQLADGEVALSSAWNGRVQKEIDAGTPVKSVDTSEMFHKEGGTDDVPLSKEECVRRVTLLVKVLTT
jgi:hypothetical protein